MKEACSGTTDVGANAISGYNHLGVSEAYLGIAEGGADCFQWRWSNGGSGFDRSCNSRDASISRDASSTPRKLSYLNSSYELVIILKTFRWLSN